MTILLLALSCPTTRTFNKTDFPWNAHDRKTMKYCQKRCKEVYSDAPCLKLFQKFDKQSYSAICGAKE